MDGCSKRKTEEVVVSEFASRLNELFTRPVDSGRALPTNRGVARALTERGQPLSASYLCQLRSGRRDSPAPAVIAALADHFGVGPSYFSGITETCAHPDDLALLARLHCSQLARLLVHTHYLSADTVEVIIGFAESLRASEGLQRVDE